MNAKLARALACATLPAAVSAAWLWLPGASAEQYGRDTQREFVSDVFGGATRTVVTGQCIRTGMPDAGSAPPGCVEAPAETAAATPPPQQAAAAAEPPAPTATPAEPAAQQPVSEPVAAALAAEQASTDSTFTEEVADTQAALAPEPEAAPAASSPGEVAATQAAMEPQPEAAAEPSPPPAPEPPMEAAEAPAPAAPQPPAQDAIATPAPPAPAAPQPRKLRLAADTRFHFDRAELTAAGTADLDALVGELAGMQVVAVTIVGYTDRIGPDAYNRKLSQRRADAVKLYLESHRLEAQRVEAIGRGKNDPVTTPGDCKGRRGQRLIKCLAPDRRVEIEIVGLSTPAQ